MDKDIEIHLYQLKYEAKYHSATPIKENILA